MAILPILTLPDDRLRQPCLNVTEISDQIRDLSHDMFETMYDAHGIGLAAPQVGVLERLFVLDVREDKTEVETLKKSKASGPIVMINPRITAHSEETTSYEEGCLSIPEMRAEVSRPSEIEVRWLDLNGTEQKMTADGLLAVCIQHELDHLNGKLFIDHLTRLKRNLLLRKYHRQEKTA